MHILCILDFLPSQGKGRRKEGVYPVFIRAHTQNNIKTAVATLRSYNIKDHVLFCSSQGAHYISPLVNPWYAVKYAVFILGYAISSKTFSRLGSWLSFIVKNYSLLSGINEYIKIRGRPDIVVGLTSVEGAGRAAFLVGKFHNIPYASRENRTYYTRGLIRGNLKKVTSDVAKSASAIFPVSPQLGKNMKQILNLEIKKIIPLQNAVADEFFKKPSGKADWIQEFSKDRFIFAGWTNWRDIKRIDVALEAFARVYKKHSETCLILAGPVPKWTQKMIRDLGLEESVWLVGSLGRKKIYDLAHSCDCCVVSSDHDPGNNSVLEAMAAGKPVIVTKCGGSESRITDSSLGEVVDRGDLKGFSLAMQKVFENYSFFDEARISGKCLQLYSEKVFAETLLSAYQRILEEPQGASGAAKDQ